MRKWMALVGGLAVMANAAGGPMSVEQTIKALDQSHRDAALRRNSQLEQRDLAADFVSVPPGGALRDRTAAIAATTAPALKLESIEVTDERIRVYGNTAIVSGISHVKGSFNGQAFDSNARYVRVWVKLRGKWQLAHFQETGLPK